MPPDHRVHPEQEKQGYNYEADPKWRSKPLTPAQILVHDVRLETWRKDRGPMLEINERLSSTLVPDNAAITTSSSHVRASDAANNPIERQKFTRLEEDYGWMRSLRLRQYQMHEYDEQYSAKCRWIHCSSKFPEYLRGVLWALSDDVSAISACLQILDSTIQRHTRFSKHGRCFAPFSQQLLSSATPSDTLYPMLLAIPFLDWTILGQKPPLRFQVDRREGFHSSRSSAHMIRSVLQHFYRLEDTTDREGSQVFAKHKPWNTNRELDLKVRQWYGHYPSALNVDELWILVVDAEHIVTFSSNQTWKSRWPPLQLTSRISDVSFRGIRNAHFTSEQKNNYTALTHAICCLSGAVGMLHRNFWSDLVLPTTDRYAGYLGHLQYRLHRSPSTKLVMDLIACQEELNIVIQITQQQIDMITKLQSRLDEVSTKEDNRREASSPSSAPEDHIEYGDFYPRTAAYRRATYRQLSASTLTDPTAQLLDNLQRELTDLQDLRDKTDRLVTRTIQLVNIRLEDHGKAILVFTVVTIIFLPLNFVSSFFGMNFRDIRAMEQTQWLFWAVALCVTTAVVATSVFLAFSGRRILEKVLVWKDRRKEVKMSKATAKKQSLAAAASGDMGFKIVAMDQEDRFSPY